MVNGKSRDEILEVVRRWEEIYYDQPGVNNIQVQHTYGGTITVHNGLKAVNPRAKFLNKITIKVGTSSLWVRRIVTGTDPVYLDKDAIKTLDNMLTECLYG